LRLVATDLDPAALRCAEANLAGTGARVLAGDLFSALPAEMVGRVSLVAANAPYVPSSAIATMPREARDHERRAALDGGADGSDLHRRICAEAPRWLAPGGYLVIEAGRAQATTTARLMADAGLSATVVEDDGLDATVVIGAAP
jgi:release factor glutamine methyltransferase